MPARSPQECRHTRLVFGSAGYYIICDVCAAYWVACRDGDVHDQSRSNPALIPQGVIRVEPDR